MSQRLLALLTTQPKSAHELGAALGLDADSIHTQAQQLRQEGVPILLSEAGYALEGGTPAPQFVQVSGQFGRAMRYAGTVGSTQDEIRRWADDPADPAPHGAVCVAERQTGGRGRRGRTWDTTHGTLVFSVLLRPDSEGGLDLSLSQIGLLPLATGVALHQACGVGGLKWPNDLLAPDRRKLAGILLEADLRGDQARRAVLGIGLNVSTAPEGAAHLAEFLPNVSRAGILSEALAALEHWLGQPAETVISAWRAANLTLGHPVQVQTNAGPVVGTALDLDEQGSLIVQAPNGEQHTIRGGDVQLVGRLERS